MIPPQPQVRTQQTGLQVRIPEGAHSFRRLRWRMSEYGRDASSGSGEAFFRE